MKRGAEKQLTKDEDDVEEVEEVEPGEGFRKADEKVLAGRQIRGLPRRSRAGSPAPLTPSTSVTPEPSVASAPKFSGFAGFGAPASGSTSFSFSAPSRSAAPSTSPSNPFQLGSTFSSGTNTSAFPSIPTVSSTASPATKAFAAFMSPSSVTPEPKPQTQNDTVSDNPRLKAETELYTALRGLNVSLLNAVSKAIETDPFTDIASVFERYKTLRISVQSDYEDNLKKVAEAPILVASAVPHSPAVSLAFGSKSFAPSDSQPKSSAAMPAPPTAFSGFGNLSSASDSGSGGFIPKLELAPSDSKAGAPGFGSFTPLTSDNASGTAPARSSFTFGRSSTSTSSPPTSAFASGDSNRSIVSKSNPFGSGAPSVFNSNLFGQPDSTDDEEKATEKDNAISSTASSVFGGASFSTPEKSSPSFAFGSSPSKPTAFGGFGGTKPGSFGNPVGFGFGSPPKTPDDTGPAPRLTGFSFGAPPPKAADATESSGDVSEAASGEATPAPEDAPQLLVTSTSIYDTEGPGEEDEETAHQIRSKVYKMSKNSDGKSEWNDLGVGVLRVKVHKEGGTRRLLLRNSSTGKVIINFNVYKDMSPSVSKNTVAFVGREGGAPASYRLRVKTAEHANDLKKAIDKEIEFVKAKASDAQ